MPLNYDGASHVPRLDLGGAIQMAMGVAKERKAEAKQQARNDEVQALSGQLATTKNPLEDPETLKVLARLNALDPQSAQFGISMLQARDEKQLRTTKEEATNASRFYQALLDTDDPVERNRFIAQTIRERQEAGQDASKITELMGLDKNKQTLMARRQLILSGDVGVLADTGLKAAIEAEQYKKSVLDRMAAERDAVSGKYGDVSSMRDDFVKQSQKYVGVRDAYTSLEAALAQASPAGDIAGVFGFMKSIDPASSVREGEQATAKNAGGVPEGIRSLYNEAIGKGGLTPVQRADFLRTSKGQLDTAQKAQDKLTSEFARLAQLRQFNPAEVIVDFSAPPSAAPAPVAGGPQQVRTKAEYDALPSGTVYTDPNGVQRRKR